MRSIAAGEHSASHSPASRGEGLLGREVVAVERGGVDEERRPPPLVASTRTSPSAPPGRAIGAMTPVEVSLCVSA